MPGMRKGKLSFYDYVPVCTVTIYRYLWRIMMNWFKGLLSAIIGGAANAVTIMIVDPVNFNFQEGKTQLATIAFVSALVSAAMYLKQSPLPGGECK